MLATAIRARLPLIAIRTTDPLNVVALIERTAGVSVTVARPTPLSRKLDWLPKNSVSVLHNVEGLDMAQCFERATEVGAVLVFVNPEEVHPMMFDAGALSMPDSMLKEFVAEYAPEEADHYELESALRGLSFKEMVEVTKLAMAESGAFTAEAVLDIRRALTVLSSGLKLVDTRQHFYEAPTELRRWLTVDGVLFTANVDRLIRPRGLLFSGLPGTGKTSGAKFIAQSLKVPMYLLDVGGTYQKYVGSSEKNFQAALAQVEALAPCVLLLDEVEKAFDTSDESGVSRRVLGMLLWWLQEHQSQIITVMTTNDVGGIPPELIRPGRIDAAVEFEGLALLEARRFARRVAGSLTKLAKLDQADVNKSIDALMGPDGDKLSQAVVTQTVVDLVKVQLAAFLKE